uniref:aspartate kinase n=1 Tax=Aegilops tauschii TaxID=37682 RepID=M8B0P1_AEGTA
MVAALRLAAVAWDSPTAVSASRLGRERASLCAAARPGGQCCARRGLVLRCQSGGGAAATAATLKKGEAADAAGFTVVMKFGGSSVSSAARMREMADLILSFPEERPVVVLSAMGKTTNNLLLAGEKAVSCGAPKASEINELAVIKELHLRTIDELGLDSSIVSGFLDELEQLLKGVAMMKELTLRTRDYLVSFGECMSTRIFAAYLNKLGKKARQLTGETNCVKLINCTAIRQHCFHEPPKVCLSGVRHLAIQTMESSQLPGGISKCEGAEKGGKFASHISRYDAFDLGFITTDDFTNADILEATYPAVAKRLHGDWIDDPAIPVVTGFLGKGWKSCAVTTLGRGGSDLTATTIGKALGLREIQVWKDVDGVLTCDPNIYANAVPVPYLTFDEAAELAYFGAQVLHPQSMRPAREGGIPVRVKNSYNRHAPGTVITKTRDMRKSILTSIVLKSNITMLDIVSTRMLGQYGFLAKVFSAKVFSIFEDLGISVDSVATSEVSISLTLDPSKLWSRELIQQELDNVVEELEKIAVVHLLQHRSIISLIGNVQRSSLILEKAFNVLRRNGVNVQMISQGASKVNISLVVNDSEAKQCVQALHSAFFENGFLSEVEEADLAQKQVPVLPLRSDEVQCSVRLIHDVHVDYACQAIWPISGEGQTTPVLLVKLTKDNQPPPWWAEEELAGKGGAAPKISVCNDTVCLRLHQLRREVVQADRWKSRSPLRHHTTRIQQQLQYLGWWRHKPTTTKAQ